jgi:hypothetical protein
MADIRKRKGAKGITYQVRYPSKAAKSGHAYKTFLTLKEARHFAQHELPKLRAPKSNEVRSVDQAIQRWLDTCEYEAGKERTPYLPRRSKGTNIALKLCVPIPGKKTSMNWSHPISWHSDPGFSKNIS